MAAKDLKGINIEVGATTTGLDKALADVEKRSRATQTELKKVDRLLKLDPKNTELVAQKQKLLKDAISNTKEKLDGLKKAQAEVTAQFKRGEIGEDQYRAFQREVVKTEQDLKKLQTQGHKTAAEISKSMKDAGDKMKSAGTSMTTTVTAPILAAGAAGVALGGEIDDAFDKIRIQTGATGSALAGLEADFEAVARSGPDGFDQISTTVLEFNRRLDLTGKPLQDLSRQVLDLSRITGTDLTTNIENAAGALKAFDVPAAAYGKSLDFVFKTSQQTGVKIDELMAGLQSNAPILRTFGLGFEESAALMGTMQKAGLDVDTAMTGLKRAFKKFANEGVKDPNKALGELMTKIKNAPNEVAAGKIGFDYFGKSGGALAVSIRRGKVSYEELLKSIRGSKDTIRGAAGETDDWDVKLKMLWNNIKLDLKPVLLKLFDSLNKMIPTIKAIADRFVGLIDAITKLPPGVQTGILVFIGLLAAIGPVLVAMGWLANGIGVAVTAFGWLGGALTTLTTSISGVVIPVLTSLGAAIGAAGTAATILGGAAVIAGILALGAAIGIVRDVSALGAADARVYGDRTGGVGESARKAARAVRDLAEAMKGDKEAKLAAAQSDVRVIQLQDQVRKTAHDAAVAVRDHGRSSKVARDAIAQQKLAEAELAVELGRNTVAHRTLRGEQKKVHDQAISTGLAMLQANGGSVQAMVAGLQKKMGLSAGQAKKLGQEVLGAKKHSAAFSASLGNLTSKETVATAQSGTLGTAIHTSVGKAVATTAKAMAGLLSRCIALAREARKVLRTALPQTTRSV